MSDKKFKFRYGFASSDFQKGDCSECPISYMVYNDQYEEWEHLCPVGSPKECPLEEVKESSLTDIVDRIIVEVREKMCDNYCKFTKECGDATDRGEDYPCPLGRL